MYSRKEASQLRQQFWTTFGQYMQPVPSASGETLNWVNYKTGERDIRIRMYADNKRAGTALELVHRDKDIRHLYYEQLLQLKGLFESCTEAGAWTWQPAVYDDHGREVSRVFAEMDDVNVFRTEDWPAMISFLKPRIMELDAFWSQARHAFESLR